MRAAIAAAILFGTLSVGAVGTAHAADLNDPVWAQAPGRSDWAKAYPAEAAAAGVSGDVRLRCTASASGALNGCQVVQETPAAYGFGAAALSLAAQMELRPTGDDGQPVAGRSLVVPVKFVPAVLKSAPVVENPDWLHAPNGAEVAKYFPADAGGTSGHVTIECVVTNRGLLDGCSVRSESPPGHGFGAATLALSQLFLMRPMTVDGQPMGGGRVVIPVGFVQPRSAGSVPTDAMASAGGGQWVNAAPPETHTITVLRAAPWSATPTAADLSAAFPHDQIGRVASAHVVLRCDLKRDGGLTRCETAGEDPRGAGFAAAARSLTQDFRAMVGPHDNIANLQIDVPFDFRDPSTAAPPIEIYNPMWLRRIDPEAALQLFPQDALKAGVRDGEAMVECEVAHDGSLTGCSVQSETPAGIGFGAAGLRIAEVMKLNPWTSQGTPVDGARIVVPITLVLPPDQVPAAPPAGTPPKP